MSSADKQEIIPTSNEEENSKLRMQKALEIMGAPKTGQSISAAVWRPDLKMAEVSNIKGKILDRMGIVARGTIYLFVEEAVYLIDRGDLLLAMETSKEQHRLMTLQEAFQLMNEQGVSMQRYYVYARFMRMGYMVRRYPSTWLVRNIQQLKEILGNQGQVCRSQKRKREVTIDTQDWILKREAYPNKRQKRVQQEKKVEKQIKTNVLEDQTQEEKKSRQWWPSIGGEQDFWLKFVDTSQKQQDISKFQSHVTKVNQLSSLQYISPQEEGNDQTINGEPVYDIYYPTKVTRKKPPEQPQFRICICEDHNFISLSDINHAYRCRDGVQLRFVSSSQQNSSAMFYKILPLRVPSLL
eukprot:TRINITY_DN5372_c0_g1_i8.p2 TRINITY_DN5372_c0_g1~~TRINITY_DN5372_c0_g1_i8.p2  ORF type:complete len:353 (-),score=38.40 TRINITY_DN5372_c0_g1_i8:222-1280(-)